MASEGQCICSENSILRRLAFSAQHRLWFISITPGNEWYCTVMRLVHRHIHRFRKPLQPLQTTARHAIGPMSPGILIVNEIYTLTFVECLLLPELEGGNVVVVRGTSSRSLLLDRSRDLWW